MRTERVAVVGAGLMGHGIAQVFAEAGAPVTIWDPNPEVRASVPDRVRANMRSLGRPRQAADQVVERITVHETLEPAVDGVDVVIEAAPEDLATKQRLFERLGALTGAGTMLATNTSVMSVASITERTEHRGRTLGTHWWNPPYLIPLVEVVQAEATDAEVVRRMIELLAWAGKTPVHVRKDVPGFVGNRLQHALWREAFRLVEEGICDPETVDVVVKSSFGRRLGVLGPIENADLVGLDLTLAIHEYLLPHLARGRTRRRARAPAALPRLATRRRRRGRTGPLKVAAEVRDPLPPRPDRGSTGISAVVRLLGRSGGGRPDHGPATAPRETSGLPPHDGTQLTQASCSSLVQGEIPGRADMPSILITRPAAGLALGRSRPTTFEVRVAR